MQLSIIIPIYKSYKLVRRALSSISIPKDSSLKVKIVLIDDTPGEVASRSSYLQNMVREYPNLDFVILVNRKNRGVTFSRNRAVSNVHSDFYIFLDSDDTLREDAIETAQNVLSKYSKNYGVFLFRTDKNHAIATKEGKANLLLKDYGSGERLVVVRSGRGLPFCGSLRGHELVGLLRFCEKNDFKVVLDGNILRDYHDDNLHSISTGTEFINRLPFLLKGHLKVVEHCARKRLFWHMFTFSVRSIYVWYRLKVVR